MGEYKCGAGESVNQIRLIVVWFGDEKDLKMDFSIGKRFLGFQK